MDVPEKDYCIACTVRQGRNIGFARSPGRFECACGTRLIDHEPTGKELVAFKELMIPALVGENQMLHKKCGTVYPADQFGKNCPNCHTENGGDLKDIYLL